MDWHTAIAVFQQADRLVLGFACQRELHVRCDLSDA